jgi:hypothetical protein
LDSSSAARDDLGTQFSSAAFHLQRFEEVFMIAVIGNVIAGLGVVSLFTATLRLSRPPRPSK